MANTTCTKTNDINSSHLHADGKDRIQADVDGSRKALEISHDTAGDTQAVLANAHLLMQASGSADPETFSQQLETRSAARAAKEERRKKQRLARQRRAEALPLANLLMAAHMAGHFEAAGISLSEIGQSLQEPAAILCRELFGDTKVTTEGNRPGFPKQKARHVIRANDFPNAEVLLEAIKLATKAFDPPRARARRKAAANRKRPTIAVIPLNPDKDELYDLKERVRAKPTASKSPPCLGANRSAIIWRSCALPHRNG
jgi:hypothetical protein